MFSAVRSEPWRVAAAPRERKSGSHKLTCMGLFLSSGCFVGFADRSLFGAGKPFFVRRLRSGSRSARKGSRDRNASAAWRRAALASLVFRSALTPEHAEGR